MTDDLRDAIAEWFFTRAWAATWVECSERTKNYWREEADRFMALLAARPDVAIVGVTDPATALKMFGAKQVEARPLVSNIWERRYVFATGNKDSVYILPADTT